ncbi:MAG TPA: hypothetical protein VNA17_10085, partial [Pyrinomonadaceae bacterium]|nr:hypothetical protein [Pyrinomonadaceae bacterium]
MFDWSGGADWSGGRPARLRAKPENAARVRGADGKAREHIHPGAEPPLGRRGKRDACRSSRERKTGRRISPAA